MKTTTTTVLKSSGACPRCNRGDVLLSVAHPLCKPCTSAIERQARREQERCYLAWWLSSREQDMSRYVRRMRALAEREGVDWHDPPAAMLFAERLALLMTPWRPEKTLLRPRPRQRRTA